MKHKQTKAGGLSKAEPPIKKQKKVNIIVEDEVAVEGKGAREKESTEDIGNKKSELQWRSTYLKFPNNNLYRCRHRHHRRSNLSLVPAKASPAKASPAKAFRTVAQASDVDFVTVSPSKDPAEAELATKEDELAKKAAELKKKAKDDKEAELAKKAPESKKKVKDPKKLAAEKKARLVEERGG
ncbi:Uncharacterized protein Rs2_18408 [Raphanus sativus]|nr:Uncharacterized protein Rs2_18408 [Raphanus sativus]